MIAIEKETILDFLWYGKYRVYRVDELEEKIYLKIVSDNPPAPRCMNFPEYYVKKLLDYGFLKSVKNPEGNE